MPQSLKRRAKRVLVLAPHPDDEVLATGGVIQEHLRKGHVVKVVLVTCGDGQRRGPFLPARHFQRLGEQRYRESLKALALLGVTEKRVIVLGYPDRGLAHLELSRLYTSPYTKARSVPYAGAYRPGAPYTQASLVQDLTDIVRSEQPEIIYLPHPRDRHGDHRATYAFAQIALANTSIRPQQRCYLIHYGVWPLPAGKHLQRDLLPPRALRRDAEWLLHELRPEQVALKYRAILCYRTQTKYLEEHLLSFARRNELFALDPPATALPSPRGASRLPRLLTVLRRARSSVQPHA